VLAGKVKIISQILRHCCPWALAALAQSPLVSPPDNHLSLLNLSYLLRQ
jgi:hypothetical protein